MPEEIKQKDYLLMKSKIRIKKMRFKLNNFKLKSMKSLHKINKIIFFKNILNFVLKFSLLNIQIFFKNIIRIKMILIITIITYNNNFNKYHLMKVIFDFFFFFVKN
jgi:hypothetical protein